MLSINTQTLKTKGFTLVELVVVILILAVLAAFALPRFTNLQRDARISKLNAARGSVVAASSLIHATVLAKNGVADTALCTGGAAANNSAGATGTVCTENGRVNIVFAYPAVRAIGAGGSVLGAAGLTTTFEPTTAELNSEGYGYTVDSNSSPTLATFEVIGGTDSATCSFTYAHPTAANSAPVISSVTTTGC